MSRSGIEPSRLTTELLELAGDLKQAGVIDAEAHDKITSRHLGPKAAEIAPVSHREVKAMREKARMTQASSLAIST